MQPPASPTIRSRVILALIPILSADVRDIVVHTCQSYGLNSADYEIVAEHHPDKLQQYLSQADEGLRCLLVAMPVVGLASDIHLEPVIRVARRAPHMQVIVLDASATSWQITEEWVVRGWREPQKQQLASYMREFFKAHVSLLSQYHRLAEQLALMQRQCLSPLYPESATEVTTKEVMAQWCELVTDIHSLAEATFEKNARNADRLEREQQLLVAQALLRLETEATLSMLRAEQNYQSVEAATTAFGPGRGFASVHFPPGFGIDIAARRKDLIARVRKRFSAYRDQLNAWDQRLGFRKHFYLRHYGDAEHLQIWSNDCLKHQELPIEAQFEPAWIIFGPQIRRELRFYYREALRREFRITRQIIPWWLLIVSGIVAGYGLRPARVFWTVMGVPLSFAALHLADDLLFGCVSMPHSIGGWVHLFLTDLFYSITTLATLGLSVPMAGCGRLAGVLISAEAISGFFLLAILASVFVEMVLER